MRGMRLLVLAAAVISGGMLVALGGCHRSDANALRCYVGGTMQPAMEKIIGLYKQQTGQTVLLEPGDSGELIDKIKAAQTGDLYVAHDPYPAYILRQGLAAKVWHVAVLAPVIVVKKDNTAIHGFKDLGKEGVRVIITDFHHSTGGRVVAVMSEKAGLGDVLMSKSGKPGRNVVDTPRSGAEARNKVLLDVADAAICWDAVAFLKRDELKVIPIEAQFLPTDVDATTSATYGRSDLSRIKVGIAMLKMSKHAAAAEKFAEFVASPAAAEIWKSNAFTPMTGRMAAQPLFVRCAAGMKLPVEKLAGDFSKSDDFKTELDFAGSEQLLGQIKLDSRGDVYVAGDSFYIDKAEKAGLVESRKVLCYFEPVIMVAKDNPRGITSLADLAKPGMKVGQGDPQAAAVGRLMPELLKLNGVDEAAWQKNIVLTTPTVNELGAHMVLSSDKKLDAVVVWRSIALQYAGKADIVTIPKEKNIFPSVEAAVLKGAPNLDEAKAFLDYLTSPHGRQVMEQNGYSIAKP